MKRLITYFSTRKALSPENGPTLARLWSEINPFISRKLFVCLFCLLSIGVGRMWGYTGTFTKYTTSTLIDGYYVIGASESSSNSSYCAGTTVSSGRITGTTLSTSNPANNIVWIIENTASGWTFNSHGSPTKYIAITSDSKGKGMAIGTTIGYFNLDGYNSSSPKGFKFSTTNDEYTYNLLKWNNSSKWFSTYNGAYDAGMAPVTLYRDNSKYRAKTTQPASGSFTASATGATWDGTKKHLSWMASGTTVTLTATPPSGMAVDTWTVTKASGGTVTVTNNQFTMPADQVTITVTWKSSGTSVSLSKTAATNGSFLWTYPFLSHSLFAELPGRHEAKCLSSRGHLVSRPTLYILCIYPVKLMLCTFTGYLPQHAFYTFFQLHLYSLFQYVKDRFCY